MNDQEFNNMVQSLRKKVRVDNALVAANMLAAIATELREIRKILEARVK